MRNLILAVLFGLFSILPAVAMAAPSQPSSCKFRVLSSGRIAFDKVCSATERRLLPHAVESIKTPYSLKADLKSAMRSAQNFYTRHCKEYVFSDHIVVTGIKATSRNWAKCYDRLPSHMMQQQMMIPSVSLKTYVWEMCGKVRNLSKLAKCAVKAATDENGAINGTILNAVEAYRTLKAQKKTSRDYIKAVTGCKLGAFGKLKCASSAGLLFAALFMFLLGRWRPQLRVAIGVAGFVIGVAACVSDASAECTELSSYEEAHKAGDMYARMRFQVKASVALPLLKILVDEDASQSIKKFAIKTLNQKIWCDLGTNTKEIIGKVKATKDFLKTTCSVKGGKLVCAGFGHIGGLFLILLTLLWGRGLTNLVIANEENKGTHRRFDGMWPACRTMIIAAIGIVIILAAGGAYAAPRTAAYGGCSVSSDESTIEIFENSCSPEVLQSLIEEVGLVCTEEHRMEGASLSMAAPTEQGLSKEADLRHRFLEALCWSEASFGGLILTFIIGLFRRRREEAQGIVGAEISDDWQKRYYPRPSLTIWVPEHNTVYKSEVRIFKNVSFVVNGETLTGCYVKITTIRCKERVGVDGRHKVVSHNYIVATTEGSWQREGYGDFVPCD